MVNAVKVMMRLEDGNSVLCTATAKDKQLTQKDYDFLLSQMEKKFTKNLEDAIYFTVRTDLNRVKNNWTLKSYQEVVSCVKEIAACN